MAPDYGMASGKSLADCAVAFALSAKTVGHMKIITMGLTRTREYASHAAVYLNQEQILHHLRAFFIPELRNECKAVEHLSGHVGPPTPSPTSYAPSILGPNIFLNLPIVSRRPTFSS
jgi:hypothetical protein